VDHLPDAVPPGTLIIASHLVAIDNHFGEKLARLAREGAVVLLDATTGRKSFNAELHRPWPAGFTGEDLEVADLESNPAGFRLSRHGQEAGSTILCRMIPYLSGPDWKAFGSLRYQCDDSPVVLHRQTGTGKLVLFRSLLGPSLLPSEALRAVIRGLFAELCASLPHLPRPANPGPGTISIPCKLGSRQALLILKSPDESFPKTGDSVVLTGSPDPWINAATGEPLKPDQYGELEAGLKDGFSLLTTSFE
jgi:hypothetical protein